MAASCLFCKIVKGEIPCEKIMETEHSFSFMDINPLAPKHCLVIPKQHGVKLCDIDDAHLADLLPVAKKVAAAIGCTNYNLLQNNGREAHQAVDHVHFHIIPKPDASRGLGISWPSKETDKAEIAKNAEEIRAAL
mmetsp:Transcript_19421/g.45427  ORF Transcript_19421/g.45427 Transcript_19421/m.45427 type:complete len:135 (-) Transcript_19421:9-413(-)